MTTSGLVADASADRPSKITHAIALLRGIVTAKADKILSRHQSCVEGMASERHLDDTVWFSTVALMLYKLRMCITNTEASVSWASPSLTNVSSRNVADILYTYTCNSMHVGIESRRPIEKSTLHVQSFGKG